MPSNNYGVVVNDLTEKQRVLAELKSTAAQGSKFTVMQFNPDVDRFDISCWRWSNIPTLLDVQACGTTMNAATATALWNANVDTVESIDFGNGYFGLHYKSEGSSYIAIPQSDPVSTKR
jgi:hypothetical protein